jgi:hypothetical protein
MHAVTPEMALRPSSTPLETSRRTPLQRIPLEKTSGLCERAAETKPSFPQQIQMVEHRKSFGRRLVDRRDDRLPLRGHALEEVNSMIRGTMLKN